jgi:NAD(P)-dependent dehydrogenase (short-subunit alcohol dehydrogenase family)
MMKGNVAVITGGGTGIGQATARRLARDGRYVAVVGRRLDKLKETANEIVSRGGKAMAQSIDVRDEAQVRDGVAAIVADAGPIGILVNCAGVPKFARLLDLQMDEYDLIMDTNLRGPVMMARAVLPSMIECGGGCIINISSEVAARGNVTATAYGATKAALNYLAKLWAVELAPHGIRVNAVAPGITDTPEGVVVQGDMDRASYMELMVQRVPLKRAGMAEDIAEAVAFLTSDAASYISGAQLSVDGGISVT